MNIKMLIKSFLFFTKNIFIQKEFDVVISYLNHFNRGVSGSNDFIDPILKALKKNNINYIIFEDTDLKGAFNRFPRNKESVPFDFITLLKIILRKKYKNNHLISGKNEEYFKREMWVSELLKKTYFRKFNFKTCINIAGDNLTFFRGLDRSAILWEYQHGVILNGHSDYLINNKVDNYIYNNNAGFLVYGDGFRNILINQDFSNYYNGRNVKKIGIKVPFEKSRNSKFKNKNILISLQINSDFINHENYVNTLYNLLNYNKQIIQDFGYSVILSHHPRYNNEIDIKHITDLPFVKLSGEKTQILLKNVFLHLTYHSTVAFEASLQSVPTVFIDMEQQMSPQFYFDQMNYPIHDFRIKEVVELKKLLILLRSEKKYNEVVDKIYHWGLNFYSEFDDKKLLSIIKGEKDANF